MFVEKKVKFEFNTDEKDIFQKMIELNEEFRDSDVCDYISCGDCPFENICNARYDTADELIEELNENIQD